MTMRVLVTGGAGFIGSHLVEGLLTRGHSVRVLDNYSTGRRENLSHWMGDIEIMDGDLRDEEQINKAVSGMDWVFHLAAFISVPESLIDPGTCYSVNVTGTVNLLEAAHRFGVQKVVLASSTAVYGNPADFPTTEDSLLQPLSPYAVSKQVNEIYARLYTQAFNLPVVPLRFFNVYGPRQPPDSPYAAVIPIFVDLLVSGRPITIYGDGNQSRDFIYVKDVVEANLKAAQMETAGEPINICSGHETTLLDLLEELSEMTPHPPDVRFSPARPGDIYRSIGSPVKAQADLGFRATTSLADGLRETINWMKTK
jgi:UDP-glucose 4-epimerase